MNAAKVGIVTIIDYDNYGNRLQNYALVHTLKKMGYEAETFWHIYTVGLRGVAKHSKLYRVGVGVVSKLPAFPIKKGKNLHQRSIQSAKIRRRLNFIKFSQSMIVAPNFLHRNTNLEEIDDQYSYFIVGSDQIWNPNFYKEMQWHFLQNVSAPKKIAYAPSIGVSELTDIQTEMFKKGLSGFSKISCREDAGARLLEKITGMEVPVVVDPTMLLTEDEWKTIEQKPSFHTISRYMLLYFLGGIPDECKDVIEIIKQEYNLEIIDILSKTSDYYTCGPEAFIYMIHNADVVLTDSYHACVFSLIYERPFLVFNRKGKSMNSRMDTLFHTFGIQGHQYESGMDINRVMNPVYLQSRELMRTAREKSKVFLSNSLST